MGIPETTKGVENELNPEDLDSKNDPNEDDTSPDVRNDEFKDEPATEGFPPEDSNAEPGDVTGPGQSEPEKVPTDTTQSGSEQG